jgi:hypothetical protein
MARSAAAAQAYAQGAPPARPGQPASGVQSARSGVERPGEKGWTAGGRERAVRLRVK